MEENTTTVIQLDAWRLKSPRRGHAENVPPIGDFHRAGNGSENNVVTPECPGWNKGNKPLVSLSRPVQSDTLSGGVSESRIVPVSGYEIDATPEQVADDIARRKKQLPDLYPATYSEWKSMLGRHSRRTHEVCPRWRGRSGFANFLDDIGPKKHDGHSLDRPDNPDRHYQPGKTAWRNKEEQANNRSTTRRVLDPASGTYVALAVACRTHDVSYETARKRLYSKRKSSTEENVIFHMLAAKAAKGETSVKGKTRHTPPAERPVPLAPDAIPARPSTLALDLVAGWPWENLSKASLDALEIGFRTGRRSFQEDHHTEVNGRRVKGKRTRLQWRFEWGLDHVKGQYRQWLEIVWDWEEEEAERFLSAEEASEFEVAKQHLAYFRARVLEAEAVYPRFLRAIEGLSPDLPETVAPKQPKADDRPAPKEEADEAHDDDDDDDDDRHEAEEYESTDASPADDGNRTYGLPFIGGRAWRDGG